MVNIVLEKFGKKSKLLKVVAISIWWQSWWLFSKAFWQSQMLLLQSMTVNLPLYSALATLFKTGSNTGISCGYCNIFKNTYFKEHPVNDCFWPYAKSLKIGEKESIFNNFIKNELHHIYNSKILLNS